MFKRKLIPLFRMPLSRLLFFLVVLWCCLYWCYRLVLSLGIPFFSSILFFIRPRSFCASGFLAPSSLYHSSFQHALDFFWRLSFFQHALDLPSSPFSLLALDLIFLARLFHSCYSFFYFYHRLQQLYRGIEKEEVDIG